MKVISSIILLFFVAIPIVFGFGGQTKMRIDEIYNNTETNILLKPTNKVEVDYFSGQKALQSTVNGELEESNVTNTELNYLSGVNSNIQDQIDSKVPLTRNIDTTSPLQGGGTLEADKTLSILQSGTAQDGYLSSTDWNTFNDKQNAITGTDGDLYYWNSGLSSLAIGSEFQVLRVSSLGFPEWVDLPISVSVTTKGDLQTYSTQAARLPVGTDGQVLQANSATSTGLEWVDADFYTSPLTTQGDLLYRNATQDTRLPIGTENQVLTVNASGLPVWSDAQGGGGGSAGINFVPDSSFEKNELLPDVDENGTGSYQTFDDNNKLDSEFNSFYFRSVWQGVTNNDTFIKDTFARTDLDGKQGLFSIWVKANADNFELCLRTDDPNFESACEDAYKLNVIGDNTWRKYEIPFIYGASSVQYDIRNSDFSGSATIEIDNIYIGTMPDGYIKELQTGDLVRVIARKTTAQTITDAVYKTVIYDDEQEDNYNTYNSTTGVFTCPKISKFRISYNVYLEGLDPSDNVFILRLTNGTDNYELARTNTISTDRNMSTRAFDFECSSIGQTWSPQVFCNNADNTNCNTRASSGTLYYNSLSIVEINNNVSTVVTQNTELTAKTANEFSAVINSSGNVLSENYDWINGNCTVNGTGDYTCNFNLGIFTQIPSCQVIGKQSNDTNRSFLVNDLFASAIRFRSFTVSTTPADSNEYYLTCSKQGADVNKSATIIGKFENINSSDLVKIKYKKSSVQVVASGNAVNALYDSLVYDNSGGAYNTTTGVFTPNKSSYYKICAAWLWDDAAWSTGKAMWFFIGDNIPQRTGIETTTTQYYNMNACNTVYYEKGVSYNPVRVQQNSTANRQNISDSSYNFITIDELPDYQAIVKNLSNQKVECQTKTLSGNVTTTGLISDWQFNNLEIGKKYSIEVNYHCYESNTSVNSKHCVVEVESPTKDFIDWHEIAVNTSANMRSTVYGKKDIIAENEILRFNVYTLNNANIKASSSGKISTVKLCELPDTYVETTKF